MPPSLRAAAPRAAGSRSRRALAAVLALAGLLLVVGPRTEVLTGPAQAADVRPRQALPADGFVDSIGVNVHLSYADTPYDRFPRVRDALRRLGVRHVRDGLNPAAPGSFYRKLETLGGDGVRTQLVLGSPGAREGEPLTPVDTSLALLREHGVDSELSGLEGPNEWDNRGGKDWARQVKDYQQALFAGVRADRALDEAAVVGPSVARRARRAAIGDLTPYLDLGNNHTYQRGGPQGDDAADERKDAAVVSGDRPVVASETGYTNGIRDDEGKIPVSEEVAALYVPRVFADFYAAGLRRTFLYELVDQRPDPGKVDDEANFGLLRHDLSPKPAYSALQRLIALTSPRAAAPGGPGGLAYGLSSPADDVLQLLLDRGDGTFTLLLWRDVDVDGNGQGQDAPSVPFRLTLAAPAGEVAVFRPSLGPDPVEATSDTAEVEGTLRADVVAITIVPGQGGEAAPPTSATRLSPAGPEHLLLTSLLATALLSGIVSAQLVVVRRRRSAGP